ncbi:hypothetical protein BOC36_01945 [Burkholderia pseudomallei]|nr:hypothetical protein BOC36_01945 [Burkholderia pseudomallei]
MPLGELLDGVQYGTSDKANTEKRGVTVLRMNNIVDGRIDLRDLKHVPLQQKDVDRWRLNVGDILVIRTNGSRDLVGTCAVFHAAGDYVFASYLIRLVVDKARAVPEFVAAVINSAAGRAQINAVSRQIMQNNINSQELRGLRIPLPPLTVQSELVAKFNTARQRADALRAQADKRRDACREEVEAMILGHRPVLVEAAQAANQEIEATYKDSTKIRAS